MSAFEAPRRVTRGSKLAIIAPSSPFERRAGFDVAVARLRERYEVQFDESLFETKGYLAGSDDRRLAELERALADDAVDAIVAARGGYGATRLLDRIDRALVARARKLLVGFSDVTALHALWANAGLRSLHGPMPAWLGKSADGRIERWVEGIEGRHRRVFEGLECVRGGVARGALLGGNLAVLCALVGTPHAPPFAGAILALEDTGERPYRIDRMLTQLESAGVLGRVAGIVVGQLTRCDAGQDGVSADAVVKERLGRIGVPVATGLPIGHADDVNEVLALGVGATLDADKGVLTLERGIFE